MPLLGVPRDGAGGSGQMPLRFMDIGPAHPIVSATAFGAAATSDGRAVVACDVVPGVPHTPSRNEALRQLHLVVLTHDGRNSDQQTGPPGRGIWFGGGTADSWFAIGAPATGDPFVFRWRFPSANTNVSPVGVDEPRVAEALRNGRFAAGVGPRGTLHIVPDASPQVVVAVDTQGQRETFPLWPRPLTGSAARVRLAPDVRRLVFQDERMLVVGIEPGRGRGEPGPHVAIRAFTVGAAESQPDPAWGDAGVWRGPDGFSPIDLLVRANGELLCVGWTDVAAGSAFTVIRIAADGTSDNRATATPASAIPNPMPLRAAIDARDGLLIAASVPNPLAALLGPLGSLAGTFAEWGLVSRRDENDDPDPAFGNQGACWAQFPGYPVGVREVVSTANGFFLVCDRPAGIQRRNGQPVVYAYEATGQPIPGFGETGVVHHDEIPAKYQVHEPTRVVAAGWRRVSNPDPFGADTFELAVTVLGPGGNVGWRYGSTQGMYSAPLVIPGQRVGVATVTSVTSWAQYIALGGWYAGPDGGGGFVTFRWQDGSALPGGQGVVTFTNGVVRLEPAANGMLAVTRWLPGAYAEQVLIRPDLTLDPSSPVPVSPPVAGLLLPDGSRVRVNVRVQTGVVSLLQVWLTRLLPDGTVDPMFGGRHPVNPAAGTTIDRARFDGTEVTNIGALTPVAHPAGGYLAGVLAERRYPGDTLPKPIGWLVTRWNADGTPATAWGQLGTAEHPGIVVINQVFADDPAGLVVVGAFEPPREKDVRIPTLWRIRYSDGQLDPTFGQQGVMSLSLRRGENRVAQAIRTRTDGTKFVPVADANTEAPTPEDLIWVDIA